MTDPLLWMIIRDSSVSNTFGWVRDGGTKDHQGWDLEAEVSTPTIAIADGTIMWTKNKFEDYGTQLLLKFTAADGSTDYAFYAHLNLLLVSAGQDVEEGEMIGTTGKTGNAATDPLPPAPPIKPHLHFEIRNTDSQTPGLGLVFRIDPQTVLGLPPITGRSLKGQWAAGSFHTTDRGL
jgi:murein DD-endopeptidase MepM/ murein hydrolase activator NlpD